MLGLQPLIDGILRHELDREGIEFFHTKKITVIGGEGVPWTLDGEYAPGSESITVTNLEKAINFVVPDTTNE